VKTLTKLTVLAAAGTAAVVAVRRFDLLNKGAALVEQGVEKAAEGAEWLTAKAVEVTDKLLTDFADQDDLASDPTTEADDDADLIAARHQRGPGGSNPYQTGDVR
jgi:hypothetical protein